MKLSMIMGLAAVICWCSGLLGPSSVASESIADKVALQINSALPRNWSIAERRNGVIPAGHYWAEQYRGTPGDEIVIEGGASVHLEWKDSSGRWHSEAAGKEALRIYVMPKDYKENISRFLQPKRPTAARVLTRTQLAVVYAHPSTHITNIKVVENAIKEGSSISWPDSPEVTQTLTWTSWRDDLKRRIR
ncbi:hypothetical protein [Ideonella sp.]|uniref:hypothetical protein n=1 Tax=Ideonella sp. TaxID=1929293 RepID=UPI0035B054F5